jgi:unsaturated rhamnogalacturonyl hydrolase
MLIAYRENRTGKFLVTKGLCFILMFMSFGCLTLGDGLTVKEYASLPRQCLPSETGMLVSQNLLQRNIRMTKTGMHYSEVCAAYGVLKFAALTHNTQLMEQAVARYEPMLNDNGTPRMIPDRVHVDDFVFGVLPLEIYMQTGDERYLKIGKKFADRQWENPLPNGLTMQTRWWIDDMYMVSSLQIQAYRATHDMKYADRAVLFLLAYLDRLQQPNGLFHHGNDSPFFWSRGNGWVAASLTEVLSSIPISHKGRAKLMDGYKKMMDTLVSFQAESGLWLQIIDKKTFWEESSGTAMFTFALRSGISHGWIAGLRYESAAQKGYVGLLHYMKTNGDLQSVCEGTSQINDVTYYSSRKRIEGDLHGQAPFLWLVNSILQDDSAVLKRK